VGPRDHAVRLVTLPEGARSGGANFVAEGRLDSLRP
jgi:hypothetical protein